MWVWSDELADRFPAIRSQQGAVFPLVAYAVDQEADLEVFAREVLGSRRAPANAHPLEPDEARVTER